MTAILFITAALSCLLFVVIPVRREVQRKRDYLFLQEYRDFQAFAVLKYHRSVRDDSALWDISIRELRREYNVSAAYDEIGRL